MSFTLLLQVMEFVRRASLNEAVELAMKMLKPLKLRQALEQKDIWLEQMANLADKNAFMRKQIEKLDPDVGGHRTIVARCRNGSVTSAVPGPWVGAHLGRHTSRTGVS